VGCQWRRSHRPAVPLPDPGNGNRHGGHGGVRNRRDPRWDTLGGLRQHQHPAAQPLRNQLRAGFPGAAADVAARSASTDKGVRAQPAPSLDTPRLRSGRCLLGLSPGLLRQASRRTPLPDRTECHPGPLQPRGPGLGRRRRGGGQGRERAAGGARIQGGGLREGEKRRIWGSLSPYPPTRGFVRFSALRGGLGSRVRALLAARSRPCPPSGPPPAEPGRSRFRAPG